MNCFNQSFQTNYKTISEEINRLEDIIFQKQIMEKFKFNWMIF